MKFKIGDRVIILNDQNYFHRFNLGIVITPHPKCRKGLYTVQFLENTEYSIAGKDYYYNVYEEELMPETALHRALREDGNDTN